jgi:hypothetical protein
MEKNDHHLDFKSLEEIDGLINGLHVLCNHKEQEPLTRKPPYIFPLHICHDLNHVL